MIFWEFLKGRPMSSVDDFFRSRLDQMIDLRHPLAILASRMPWLEIEAALASQLARQAKAGKLVEALDLFGAQTVVVGGGRSNAGRPRLPASGDTKLGYGYAAGGQGTAGDIVSVGVAHSF